MQKQKVFDGDIVISTPVFDVYLCNSGNGVPVAVAPPYAGREGDIAKKLIDKCIEYDRTVLAFHLKEATSGTKDTSIEDLVNAYRAMQMYAGEPVYQIGLCQGGWLSALFAALYPDTVKKLALFAAPINTKTGTDNIIERYMRTPGIVDFHKWMTAVNGGIQKGCLQWLAFSMTSPIINYYGQWYDLFMAAYHHDKKELKKQKRNVAWNLNYKNLAGSWFLNCLENHFSKNRLYTGTWKIGSRVANLKNITCPVYAYAGEDDNITHYEQMFGIADVVGTPRENINLRLLKGAGHTACFTKDQYLEPFAKEFFEPACNTFFSFPECILPVSVEVE